MTSDLSGQAWGRWGGEGRRRRGCGGGGIRAAARTWILGQMRAGVFGPGAGDRGWPVAIVVAQALGAPPDRVAAVDVAAHGDAQAGTGPPARLLGELEGHALEDHDIVLADGALLVLTQDRVEINAVEGHEGAGGVGGGVRELGVVVRDEPLGEIGIGGGARGDPGQRQLVDQPALDGAVEPLAPAAGLGE